MGQLGDGELLQLNEDRAHGQEGVPQQGQARADVFDYIERFYNPTRRHSTLGYVSPLQLEQAQEAQVGVNETGSSPQGTIQALSLS